MLFLSGTLMATGTNILSWAIIKTGSIPVRKAHEVFLARLREGQLDPNHDVERAILRAHYGALQFLVAEAVQIHEWGEGEPGVHNARLFLTAQLKAVNAKNIEALTASLAKDWKGLVPATFEGADISVPETHVDAALAELLGVEGWDENEKQILTHLAYDKTKGWVLAFSAHIRHELKENKEFRAIYTAEVLNIHTIKLDALLEALPRLDEIARDVKEVKEITADTNFEVKKIKAMLTSIMAANHYTNKVGHQYPDYLATALQNLNIPEERWEAEILDALERFVQGMEQLKRHTNLPADMEAKRAEAFALFKQAKLDEGEAILEGLEVAITERFEATARDRARILVDRVPFAAARFDFDKVMDLYERAAQTVLSIDRDQAVNWLWKAASIGYSRGEISGYRRFLDEAGKLYQQALTYVSASDGRALPNQGETWGALKNNLGLVYATLGERGDDAALAKVIKAYEDALKEWRRDKLPLQWATTKNNLGSAYVALGARGEEGALEKAILAFEDALEERTRDKVPLQWATTKNNLGSAYAILGERGEEGVFEKAILAFEDALEERTRDKVPLDWATTKNNLGNAYALLGERGEEGVFEKAILAFEDALEERTRDKVPLDWAATKNNLGNVYLVLGARGEEGALEQAILAFEDALEERICDKVPLDWAMTMANMGRVLWGKGDFEAAKKCLRGALGVFRELEASYYVEHVGTTMRGFGLDPDVQ
ncbi:MAG: hypothetical protein COA69_01485 [Robiginitomaculum sp.]|nr:MAG: hypothetical protein COA69_01485 [Robiginitomaculum sp.]